MKVSVGVLKVKMKVAGNIKVHARSSRSFNKGIHSVAKLQKIEGGLLREKNRKKRYNAKKTEYGTL